MILRLRRFRGGPVEGFLGGASLETFSGEAQLINHPVELFVGKLEAPLLSMNLLTWSPSWTFSQGMYINHDDLVTLATGPSGQGEAILQGLDR